MTQWHSCKTTMFIYIFLLKRINKIYIYTYHNVVFKATLWRVKWVTKGDKPFISEHISDGCVCCFLDNDSV